MIEGWGLDLALAAFHRVADETLELVQSIAGAIG